MTKNNLTLLSIHDLIVTMYLRKSIRTYKGKTYTNYLLVESVQTEKGPRQKTICSIGDLGPRPAKEWLRIAHKVENALIGQNEIFGKADAEVQEIVQKIKERRNKTSDDIVGVRAEAAFRAMKSPLSERPIFHQVQRRVETHIFLCVLAYHLLVAIEKTLLDKGIHTSWWTIRQTLKTHHVCTVKLPADNGKILCIRKSSTPEPAHRDIYKLLNISEEVMLPKKYWTSKNGDFSD